MLCFPLLLFRSAFASVDVGTEKDRAALGAEG